MGVGGLSAAGGLLALLLRGAAAEVEAPPVEAPGELVGPVDGALVLRPQARAAVSSGSAASQERVDAGDEDGGAGARGVGVAGEDGGEVEVVVKGRRGRGVAPASVCLVVFVVIEIVVVVVRHVIDVVDKVLVDVLVVVVVVGVLLEENEFYFSPQRVVRAKRKVSDKQARKGEKNTSSSLPAIFFLRTSSPSSQRSTWRSISASVFCC